MKVKVISENCIGCGACEAIAEGIFEVSDVSKVVVDEVPEDKVQEAKDAIESCPTQAIVEEKEVKENKEEK